MAKFECPFCDSAFLKFVTSESELRQHVLVAHGRILDFGSQTAKLPVSDAKDYVRINLEEKEPSSQSSN
jgi:pSer/pThr/pTyr-binding forkhead associated (FHA) protein